MDLNCDGRTSSSATRSARPGVQRRDDVEPIGVPDRRRRADVHDPGESRRDGAHVCDRSICPRQQVARAVDERRTRRREADLACGALEQDDVELVLQRPHGLRDALLRDPERLGRAGEAQRLRDGQERAQLPGLRH
jgi:hypothetical protein